jgi:hypothetical protein
MSTSSKPPGTQYTEADWNEDSIKEVEQKGKDTPGSESYRASKTLAERALWSELVLVYRQVQVLMVEFVDEEKPSWDAVAICPPLVRLERFSHRSMLIPGLGSSDSPGR